MFNTPPHKMVLTRGAKQRMLETQSAREEPSGDVRTTGDREVAHKSEPEYRGSMKSVKTSHTRSSKMSSRKELEAQKKLIELEAAEARAKVELEIIDRKMAAKLAALEEQQCSDASSQRSALSKRVEDWLENGEKSVQIEQSQTHENSDFAKLAQALKDVAIAATANATNSGMVSRLCTPKELPTYFGDPMEWLAFKQAYEESTEVCRFSAKENMWRLRNCLKGAARDSVTALLISAADPEAVMSTLELQFGQPDIILPRILRDIQKLHPVSPEYHKDIVSFSIKVKNYVAAVRCLSQEEYLRGVNITSLILSKLPPILLSKWSDYSYPIISVNSSVCRLEILSKFLSEEALKMSKTSVSLCVSNDYKNKQYSNSKSVMLVQNNVGIKSKCKYCNIAVHSLFKCKKFIKSLRKDRWEYVKRHGLCYKCINGRHNRETCPAPACDVDGCNMSHHRLLHSTLPQQNVSTAQLSNVELQEQNVTTVNSCTLQEPNMSNVNTCSSSQCLLKVVRVNC